MPIVANGKYYIIKANGKYYDIVNPFAMYTLTIVPTPADATVTLTAQGYSQVGNSIKVRKGTVVNWTVSKNEYYTQSGTITVDKDIVQNVSLVYAMATLTIEPTPADSTVTLTASGYTQVGNTIKVQKGTSVSWSASKEGYITQTGSKTVNDNENLSIELESEFIPETVRFNYTGNVQQFIVPKGCRKLIVDCVGAKGGDAVFYDSSHGSSFVGGLGGRVQCNISVQAGQSVYIYVGGKGKDSKDTTAPATGGYNGGGTGAGYYLISSSYFSSADYAAGGGGSSDIRINGTSLSDRKIIAGAGGGAATSSLTYLVPDDNYNGGAGGGLIGGDGEYSSPAKGGTQTEGGKGYQTPFGVTCKSGTLQNGGSYVPSASNDDANRIAAGGGGGYYGGGAGSVGGAGGSSYTDPTLCTNVIHTQGYSQATGNGWIIITTSNK